MAKLTAISVENIKPATGRREVPDSGCRGLYLVVQPSGRKSWAVRYRFGGKPRKLTLASGLTLAAARKAATDALHQLEQGRDPSALKVEAKAEADKAAAELAADTVEHHGRQYLERYAMKKTREVSWKAVQYTFDKIMLPAWRGRTIHDIRRRDVIDLLEQVAEDRPILANRAHAHLSRFFGWLMERDVLAASPVHGVKRPSEEVARDRILTEAEIKSLWLACDAIGGQAGACIKMLMLTGQRRSECGGMQWAEINGDVWTLPPARTKNHKRHVVPLSRQALALLDAMPRVGTTVFNADKPFKNFSRLKRKVDAIMQPAAPFVWHDLRRTAASGMAALGIRLPVIEKVLNHSSGTFRGTLGVYQRHDFAAEKRDALQRWADHVDAIARGEPAGNVVKWRA